MDVSVNGPRAFSGSELVGGCTSTTPITVTLTAHTETPALGALTKIPAFVWWTGSGTACGSIPANGAENWVAEKPDLTLLDADTLVFPEDFSDSLEFSKGTVLNDLGVCAEDGTVNVNNAARRLCIGIDSDNDDAIDADFERYGWVEFEVDSEAPPAPDAPEVTSLDGALHLTTVISGTGDQSDLAKWRAYYRLADDTEGDAPPSCTTWKNSKTRDAAGAHGMEIAGLTNGTTYDLCLVAEDDAGNVSEPSPVVRGTPTDECDFAECFPGGVPSGYCGALGAPGLAAWAAVLLLARRGRRRRTP